MCVMCFIWSAELQKCISSKSKLDGQVIENKNVKDVSKYEQPGAEGVTIV